MGMLLTIKEDLETGEGRGLASKSASVVNYKANTWHAINLIVKYTWSIPSGPTSVFHRRFDILCVVHCGNDRSQRIGKNLCHPQGLLIWPPNRPRSLPRPDYSFRPIDTAAPNKDATL